MDPHRPYVPPIRYSNEFESRKDEFIFDIDMDDKYTNYRVNDEELATIKNLYQSEVRYMDECIGDLFDFLEESQLIEDALIIITGDHGEAFMEHNTLTHPYNKMYNENIHVPLLIYGLEKRLIEENVQLLDLAPTILDIIGSKKNDEFLGRSILDTISFK